MSVMFAVCMIILILLAIVALCLAAIWLEKHYPGEDYDERQKLCRYRASRLSQFVGFIYFLIVAVILIGQVDGKKAVEPYLLVIFGVLLQAMVEHTYCLLTHSALPFSQKPSVAIVGFLSCGVLQLLSFAIRRDMDPLSLVGHGSSGWVNLTVGIGFFYLALMHLIQQLWQEKE